MIRWALKLSEFNIEWEHRPGVQNVVADLLSRNPVDSVEGSQISCAALRALAINSREQFIKEQREDPELGHIYRYLENPDDGSVNATICESWSQDFKLINGLLFYAKYFSTLGELRVYIPGSLRKDIMKEFHDLPLAGHLGKRKTYLKLRDTCYFPFMRKYIFEYVSTCDRCQKFNYKNALPAGRLMPIVSKYPNEIVTLDLLGPYPASRPERYKFILVISDHFTKWCELIPLRKASAQTIANAFFNNYIARYGAPISLISDNGPQFISDVFEHLSHRLDIKHMKTVTYRPQSNLTERVNRNLVQMIASFVEENHENWDQFLHEFAFALRTAVNETTNKTPAELFLGRKIITPFSKLINVKEDAKYVGNNIERLFDEARRNMQKQHKYWEKHYNLRRRDVHIKVNDLVLLQTHFLSAAGKKQVGKFMPKFEGPYKVLEIKGNNLVIWKNGRNITVNIDQVRVYRPRQSDTISSDSPIETLYDEQEVSHGSNRSNQGQFKEHRKTSSQESERCRSRQSNTTREIPRNKRKINSTTSKDPTIKNQRYVGKDPDKDLIIRTGKDTLLSKGKESRGRSLPRSRPKLTNLTNLIPLHQEYSPLQVHQSYRNAELLRLQVDPEWKLVDVITRPVRPERQREDTTNKRRKQSGRIKPIQEDLANTIYGTVYKKKTESMRTSTTSKSTAYLAAYSAEEASVWKR
ncbi:retrovirus-related Pol polyprotein from transposon 412 [Trichonephila clavipes]|nr:retrovirus-related Pol polyprotein from transposon 412 [Trichonephila clavipes]